MPLISRFVIFTTLAVALFQLAALRDVAESAFPGGNGLIAFDNSIRVQVMNADGSGQTSLPPVDGISPVWSPDGTKVAFVRSTSSFNLDIWVMNASGSGQMQLTTYLGTDSGPAWSPDGTKIAFNSDRSGNFDVYVMNADGSGQAALTSNPAYDTYPTWSPDGNKIAFTSQRDLNSEIYVMNSDGTAQTNISNSASYDDASDWSADGSKIAFITDRAGDSDIYVMNANGTGALNLTSDANEIFDTEPSWSPDSTKIVFSSYRDGDWEIYSMTASGSAATNLTDSASSADRRPDWQPDSDSDGILPPSDACPIHAGPGSNNGCPVAVGGKVSLLRTTSPDPAETTATLHYAARFLAITAITVCGFVISWHLLRRFLVAR